MKRRKTIGARDRAELVKFARKFGPKRTMDALSYAFEILAVEYYESKPYLSGMFIAATVHQDAAVAKMRDK